MLPDRVSDIHPSIVRAICRVQSGLVGSIKQDGKNQHGGYKYASTDAVYAALTLKLAEAGLSILALEDHAPEIKRFEVSDKKSGEIKVQQWGKFSFGFILATEEATWHDAKSRRSLFIQITGPQTFMAAESYAMKAFLRSLFKLPTGDIDLDAMPQEKAEHEEAAPKRKSSAAAKRDNDQEKFNELRSTIAAASTIDQLRSIYMDNANAETGWADMPSRWAQMLQDDYDVMYDDLSSKEGAFA